MFNTFVKIDKELLEQRYDVASVYIKKPSPALFTQLWQQTQDVDLVVAWFASWHSLPIFLAAAARRMPRILITGGYDVAYEPEINYGLRLGGLPRLISGIVFRLATIALPFSEASYQEALRNTPLTVAKTKTILLGVLDNSLFATPATKEPIVFTVAAINAASIARKGIKILVEAAQYLPDIQFVIVGKALDNSIEKLQEIATPNVKFTGFMSDEELAKLRRQAKVYAQPSVHEGFGLAVAEAMLARCIPVVSQRGSLPEVVGNTGIYTDLEPEAVANAIQKALQIDDSKGVYARQRILETFPIEHRAEQLYAAIDSLLK